MDETLFWIQFKPIEKNNFLDRSCRFLLVAYLNSTMEMFVIDDQAIRSIGRFNLFPRVLAPRNCAFIASIWWLSVRIIKCHCYQTVNKDVKKKKKRKKKRRVYINFLAYVLQNRGIIKFYSYNFLMVWHFHTINSI